MSELIDRAKASLEGVDPYQPWDVEPFEDDAYGVRYGVYAADSLQGVCRNEATAKFFAASRQLVPELIAEIERLHTWDGLMSLLDEHWPEDIFPTMEDRANLDPGPRIVSLIRTAAHWRALWKGTVEDSTKVIQERDEASREVERLKRELKIRTMELCHQVDRQTGGVHPESLCGRDCAGCVSYEECGY